MCVCVESMRACVHVLVSMCEECSVHNMYILYIPYARAVAAQVILIIVIDYLGHV